MDARHRRNEANRPGLSAETIALYPRFERPLVRVDPHSGAKSLNLTDGATVLDAGGKPNDEAAEALFRHATRPQFQYRHGWSEGDLIVWQNPRVLHRATLFDTERESRLLYRVMINTLD